MYLIIIQFQRQSPLGFSRFQVSKILAQSIFSIGIPHSDTRINASNVSSFNRILQSFSTQNCLENPRSYTVVLAKPKLQSVPSRSCMVEIAVVIGIWKCLLECQDWNPNMSLFANCSHCICDRLFLESPSLWLIKTLHTTFLWSAQKERKKTFIYGQNGIRHVLKTSNSEHCFRV